ncbi:hypothetical protein N9544_00050 [Flavobacteriales bacterium]|nr:hypothetical protein [Flavobacteriales bacterium]
MKKLLSILFIVSCFVACKKEIGPQQVEDNKKGVGELLILNEGNFGFGNASVSIYNPDTKEIYNNQFQAVNGFGIGDVLQSVNRYGDNLYFVVNNSGKIVITDTNLVYISEITGFNSPRYIEFVNGKGFVTDLKQKAVYVIDLVSNQIINQIKTQGWTEQIILFQNKLLVMDRGDYLSNSNPNTIYVINPATLVKEDSIAISINPNSMVIDKDNKLWVLTSGESGVEVPKLSKYDISTKNLINAISILGTPSRLIINEAKDELYFINSSIYNMAINDTIIPNIPFYQKSTENFYGLYFENRSKDIYITDAKNFNQQGEVIRINISSILLDKFSAGLIPQNLQ